MSWVSFPGGTREVVSRGEGALGYRELALGMPGHTTRPAAQPLVLVHGWMMTGTVWATMLGRLAAVGEVLRCVVVDLRGVGLSSDLGAPIDLPRLAGDVSTLLDELDLREVSLVGHSMGGQVAALTAALRPERVSRLTLVCPVPPEGLPLPTEVATGFRGAGGNEAALGSILDAATKSLDPAARAELVAHARHIAPEVIAAGFDAWTAGGITADVARIRAATTVIATDDPFLPAALLEETWVRRIDGARLVKHDGPGHYPQIEDAEAFAARLLEVAL